MDVEGCEAKYCYRNRGNGRQLIRPISYTSPSIDVLRSALHTPGLRSNLQRHMYLVQILLPVYDNHGKLFPEARFTELSQRLAHKFGGVTSYRRAPASGLWKPRGKRLERDELIHFEVMVARLGRAWWSREKKKLKRLFRQHQLIVRACRISLL